MGKRRRRLHSPKFAKKYASVREAYNHLRGVAKEAEADGVITEEEAVEIKQAKEEVIEAVVKTVVETVTSPVVKSEPLTPRTPKKVVKTPAPRSLTKKPKKTKKERK